MDKTKSLKINIEQFSYTPSNPIFLKNKIEIGLGEIVGIVAPNGYGKSTLMDIIAGNIVSSNCEIQYGGLNAGMNIKYKAIVTKMLEPMDLYEQLTGLDHMELFASSWGKKEEDIIRIEELLGMSSYIKKKVSVYSLGMRQKLCLALCLISGAEVYLFDEVLNGLDQENVKKVESVIFDLKNNGNIVLLASHLLENLDECYDRVLFLKDGKLIDVKAVDLNRNKKLVVKFIDELHLKRYKNPYPVELVADNKIVFSPQNNNEIKMILDGLLEENSGVISISLGREKISMIYRSLYG